MKETKVCLSIIVKNESKVIERLLNTVWPILDHYIVVDTGSTDGTQEIVRKFFESKGIPGEVIEHEWKGFGEARNFALAQSKKTGCSHSFWIDADEQLILDPQFNKETFKKALSSVSSATIQVKYGNTTYTRNQFWSNEDDYYWYGPVHEVLMCDNPTKPVAFIKGLTTLVTPDGNSWTTMTQQEKYERDAKLLEEYVANDPKKDPRWVFYLAQSYRDAVTVENAIKSIEWYTKRRDMNSGFQEERYYSQLMVSTLKARVNAEYAKLEKPLRYTNEEIINDFMLCSDYDSMRAEHFIPLAKFYHQNRRYTSAYILTSYAMKHFHRKSPYPKRGLFVDPETYSWKIADTHAISCWYTNNKDESRKAMNQCTKAIQKGEITDPNEVTRIKNNLKFYKTKNDGKQEIKV